MPSGPDYVSPSEEENELKACLSTKCQYGQFTFSQPLSYGQLVVNIPFGDDRQKIDAEDAIACLKQVIKRLTRDYLPTAQ